MQCKETTSLLFLEKLTGSSSVWCAGHFVWIEVFFLNFYFSLCSNFHLWIFSYVCACCKYEKEAQIHNNKWRAGKHRLITAGPLHILYRQSLSNLSSCVWVLAWGAGDPFFHSINSSCCQLIRIYIPINSGVCIAFFMYTGSIFMKLPLSLVIISSTPLLDFTVSFPTFILHACQTRRMLSGIDIIVCC